MSADSRHIVLGAGPVGRALVDLLQRRGTSVRVVTRTGRARVPEQVEVVAADVADVAAVTRACQGATVVYGCVGLDYRNWTERWPPMMRGMLAAAEAAGARFIFMDNLYMYGPVAVPMTEHLPLTGYGRKPATRAMVTRLWQEAHTAGRVQATAVRASDFYGPGVTNAALGDYSVGRLAQGKAAQCLGSIDQPHSMSYVPDVARALVTLAEADDSAMGEAWHVPNAPDLTLRELLQMFAERLDTPLKVTVLTPWLLSALGLFDGNIREVREMLYQWQRPFRVDHSKFGARFWSDATQFEPGVDATVAWYRERS